MSEPLTHCDGVFVQKLQEPYTVPSLVDMVTAFGENDRVSDRTGLSRADAPSAAAAGPTAGIEASMAARRTMKRCLLAGEGPRPARQKSAPTEVGRCAARVRIIAFLFP